MPLTPAGEANVLTSLLSGRFVSLHTANPGDSGASEVATGGYARQAGGTFGQTGSNPTTASNNAVIEFPVATAAWGTVTHFGIWSAASGGTLLAYAALTNSKAVAVDDVVRYLAGKLRVTAD